MSQGDFERNYFDVEADPHLSFILQDYSQRKPSCDQLFNETFSFQINNEVPIASSELLEIQEKKTLSSSKPVKKQTKRRQNAKPIGPGKLRGHWCLEQNKRYHWFLQMHSTHFLNKRLRRMDRIFKSMEIFIGSRQAEQCRSHHQKMEKKHSRFTNILKELRKQHYSSEDIEPIVQDMKINGVQCNNELLTWSKLQDGTVMKSQQSTSQSITLNDCPAVMCTFIDPLLQIQEGQCSLGDLLL